MEKEEKESVTEETEKVHGDGFEHNRSRTSFAIYLFLFRLVVPLPLSRTKSEDATGGRGKEGREGRREKTAQVDGQAIQQNTSTTYFAFF